LTQIRTYRINYMKQVLYDIIIHKSIKLGSNYVYCLFMHIFFINLSDFAYLGFFKYKTTKNIISIIKKNK